jgi:Putative prokaryotic signal transducing protein
MEHLTTAASQPEAETIRSLLQSAGIAVVMRGDALAYRAPALAGRDIYVDEKDIDRARELLKAGGSVSEAELIEAEEEDAAARAEERPIPSQASGSASASARRPALWARLRGRS